MKMSYSTGEINAFYYACITDGFECNLNPELNLKTPCPQSRESCFQPSFSRFIDLLNSKEVEAGVSICLLRLLTSTK